MKLSQGVEWGLHRAMLPAQAPEGGLTRRDPPAPPAEHITVLDIVEAIEGTAPPFLRQEIRRRGTGASTPEERLRPCPVNSVTREAHSAWQVSLRSVPIAELVSRLPRSAHERNGRLLAASWCRGRQRPPRRDARHSPRLRPGPGARTGCSGCALPRRAPRRRGGGRPGAGGGLVRDVPGCRQPFLDGGAHAPLGQHRLAVAGDRLQQAGTPHAAGACPQRAGAAGDEFGIAGADGPGGHRCRPVRPGPRSAPGRAARHTDGPPCGRCR